MAHVRALGRPSRASNTGRILIIIKDIPNSRRTTEEDLRSTTNNKINDLKERLRKLAQSPLKWGTMPIPGHVQDTADSEDIEGVLHLGFGDEATVEDQPKEGQRYIWSSAVKHACSRVSAALGFEMHRASQRRSQLGVVGSLQTC